MTRTMVICCNIGDYTTRLHGVEGDFVSFLPWKFYHRKLRKMVVGGGVREEFFAGTPWI